MTIDDIYENLIEIQEKTLQAIAWINQTRSKREKLKVIRATFPDVPKIGVKPYSRKQTPRKRK